MVTVSDVAAVLGVTKQAVQRVCVKEKIPKTGRQWLLTPTQLQVLVRRLRLRKGRPSKADKRNYREEVARIVAFASKPKPAKVTKKPIDDLNAKAERAASNLESIVLKVSGFWSQRDHINPDTVKRIRQAALSFANEMRP